MILIISIVAIATLLTGCSSQHMKALADTDRQMADRYGGRTGVQSRSFVYKLYLGDGSSVCKRHDGSFEPMSLKGGSFGNRKYQG